VKWIIGVMVIAVFLRFVLLSRWFVDDEPDDDDDWDPNDYGM